MTSVSPVIFAGCNPIDGSSSTYSTPVVRLRTARASCMRCLSPVESVEEARSRERYPSPRSFSRFATVPNDSHMLSAMGRISSGRLPGTPSVHAESSLSVMRHASSSDMPRSLGARARSDSRVPPQSGHGPCFKNRSTLFIPLSSFTLESAFSTVYTAL